MSRDQPVPRLSDEQLHAFDHDTTSIYRLDQRVIPLLNDRFPDGRFRFLDLGGGNGNFTDRILDCFGHAEGTVVDYSAMLLARNRPRPQKQCKRFDLLELSSLGDTYDVIFCNWVLHHILSNGFSATRTLQRSVLVQARQLLVPGGTFVIAEELKNGWFDSDIPNALIFHLTRSRILAPVTKRFGANTAGVGVAFLSQQGLTALLASVFSSVQEVETQRDTPPRLWRYALMVRSLQNAAVFCCSR